MANVNKLILIGRLTADPEVRTFSNGGKVAKLRLAVNNRRKNSQSGQWEDYPMYIDCDAFNRGENGKTADLAEQYLAKGRQVYLEGRLELETWDDKTTGQKRSKHKMIVDNIQFLDNRQQDGGGEGGGYAPRDGGDSFPSQRPAGVARNAAPQQRPPAAKPANSYTDDYGSEGGIDDDGPGGGPERESDIPF